MPVERPSVDTLCEHILDGKTQAEIATIYGVTQSTVSKWLLADEEAATKSARAREESAESWLDRGMSYLEGALSKESGIDAGAARALAQECARRAAIRNPRYRDKVDLGGNVAMTVSWPVAPPKIERADG